jgi:hypothetical protein
MEDFNLKKNSKEQHAMPSPTNLLNSLAADDFIATADDQFFFLLIIIHIFGCY